MTLDIRAETGVTAAASVVGGVQIEIPGVETILCTVAQASELRDTLAGLSTSGGSTFIGQAVKGLLPAYSTTSEIYIAPGAARRSGMAADIALLTGVSKTTGAWVEGSGNGGLDTGTIEPNKGYHLHLIFNPTTLVVDVLISLSYASPTLPTGFTAFVPFNGFATDGLGSIRPGMWYQNGEFRLGTAYASVLGAAGNIITLAQLELPVGVKMKVRGQTFGSSGGVAFWIIIRDPDLGTIPDVPTQWYESQTYIKAGSNDGGPFESWTDASGQIYHVAYGRDATNLIYIYLQGWTYPRDEFA